MGCRWMHCGEGQTANLANRANLLGEKMAISTTADPHLGNGQE